MAQVTETVARGILAGHGYTDNEVRQLAHHWLASHGQAPASVLHLVHSAFAEIAMAFPKAFALHKVGIADTAVRKALAAYTPQAAERVPAISYLPPLPDPDLRDVGTKPQDVKDFLNGYATEYARLALAARAPEDSVQEEDARLDWLEQNLFHREMDEWDVKFGGRGDQNMWVLFAPKGVQGSARRIIDAARKQGEKQ